MPIVHALRYFITRPVHRELMTLLSITSILISLSAVISDINYRTLKLPTTIGIMAISLLFQLTLVLLSHLGWTDGG